MVTGITRSAITCSIVAALLVPPSSAKGASAEEVVVVRATDLPGYRAVERSFLEALGRPARAVLLAPGDIGTQLAATASNSTLVLAIGPDAAAAAAKLKGPKVLYALVPRPARLGLEHLPGIPMEPSAGRQLRALRSVLPRARRIGVVFNPAESAELISERSSAAEAAGLTLVRAEAASPAQVADALRMLLPKVNVLWLLPDPTVVSSDTMRTLLASAASAKVPILGFTEVQARAGALIAVEGQHDDMGRKAAAAARKLLAGGGPIVAESPEGALFLNARTAQALGLEFSDAARAKAARVFE